VRHRHFRPGYCNSAVCLLIQYTIGVTTLAIPQFQNSTVVLPAPAEGAGNWVGAASVVLKDGAFWLAYRVRRPLAAGRGVATVVARSSDGVTFEQVAQLS
jgi:hypothetical protein